jgi:hypothetical protein
VDYTDALSRNRTKIRGPTREVGNDAMNGQMICGMLATGLLRVLAERPAQKPEPCCRVRSGKSAALRAKESLA